MVREVPAVCHYKCDEEGLMCEHCERTVRPSCAGLVPGLEFLADTGSEEDLISRTDTQVHFPGTPIGKSARPVSLITANGPVQGKRIGQTRCTRTRKHFGMLRSGIYSPGLFGR